MAEVTQTGSGWASGRVLAPGARIAERYRVERFIAAGGMGEVYEVTDEVLGERVALKVLTSKGGPALEDEVKLARRVTHPNVCRVFDLGLHRNGDQELRFITMELVRGEPLSAVLARRGPLPAAEVEALVAGVCAALSAAHASGVVHGDLKPSNVLLTASGRVAVMDFGLARGLEGSAPSSYGTPGYVSPEQVAGLPLTPASDLYALGVMVFELLTGELPFRGASATETAALRLHTPPDVSRLPLQFRAPVLGCLSLDPAQRPSAAAFATRGGPRWRRLALAAGVLALLALAGFALTRGAAPPPFVPFAVKLQVVVEDDPWLARAATRLFARELEQTRWVRVVETGGEPLQITIKPEGERVRLGTRLRAAGHTVEAGSVRDGFQALVPAIVASLGGEGDAPATLEEQAAMRRFGARDLLAFRAFIDADECWRAEEVDTEAIIQRLEQALTRDPGWARLWAKLVALNGSQGQRAGETLARAQRAIVEKTDPAGETLLAAQALLQQGDAEGAVSLLAPLRPQWTDDMVVGWVLYLALYRLDRYDEAASVNLRQFELRPELQWGANVIDGFYNAGREGEIAPLVLDWVERAPESEQAVLAAAHLAAYQRDPVALEWLRRLRRLHGAQPGHLASAARIYLSFGHYADARRSVAAVSERGPLWASRAQALVGTMAIMQGHLESARDSLLPALAPGRPFGMESLTTELLTSLARLDEVAGRTTDAHAHLVDLAQTLRAFGDVPLGTAVGAEAELLSDPRDCSGITATLAQLEGPAALTARRHLVRVASRWGCADCAEVLKEGQGLKEPSNETLLIYGRCAADANQLVVARRALERAARLTTIAGGRMELESPFDAVLARFYLAGVAARQGDVDEAIRQYTGFLAQWGDTEVSVPELAQARAELARLRPQ